MIIDSHCHLHYAPLVNDIDQVITRAKAANVMIMQTVCTKLADVQQIKTVAEKYDGVFCSIGIHPHEVEKDGVLEVATLVDLTNHPKVIAIGETGLDFYYEHSPRDLQSKSFINHILASSQTNLPLIVHTRSADRETIDILSSQRNHCNFSGVIHCFSGSASLAKESLDLGFYISIAGIATFKKADDLRAIIKTVPLDRLLVETDAPYLAPVPMRGKTNEPSFVKYIVECLAEIHQVSSEKIAEQTTKNFFALFTKATDKK